MLTAFDDPIQARVQIWNHFIFAGETIVKDVVIPKTEAGAWSEQDNIFDDRKPIINHGISLIDILVDRVSVWTFPDSVPIVCNWIAKEIVSAQSCAPVPVPVDLAVILQSYISPYIVVGPQI